MMDSHEHFTRLWTAAQPKVAGSLNARVSDFQEEVEDLLQEVAVVLLRTMQECVPHDVVR